MNRASDQVSVADFLAGISSDLSTRTGGIVVEIELSARRTTPEMVDELKRIIQDNPGDDTAVVVLGRGGHQLAFGGRQCSIDASDAVIGAIRRTTRQTVRSVNVSEAGDQKGRVPSRVVRILVALPETLLERLDAIAKQRGDARSSVIREAIRRFVESNTP